MGFFVELLSFLCLSMKCIWGWAMEKLVFNRGLGPWVTSLFLMSWLNKRMNHPICFHPGKEKKKGEGEWVRWHLTETRSLLCRGRGQADTQGLGGLSQGWGPSRGFGKSFQLPVTATLSLLHPCESWGMNRPYGERSMGCKFHFLMINHWWNSHTAVIILKNVNIKIHCIKVGNSKIALTFKNSYWPSGM